MGEVESLEAHYSDLRKKLNTGAITPDAFRREVAKLWFEDADGHTWMIGAHSGHWYVYEHDQWQPAQPARSLPAAKGVTCPECDEPIKAGAAFCAHCGYRLPELEAEAIAEPEIPVASLKAPPAPAATPAAAKAPQPRRVAVAAAGVLILLCVLGLFAFSTLRNGTLFAAAPLTPAASVRASRTPTGGTAALISGTTGIAPTALIVALVTSTSTPTAAPTSTATRSLPATTTPTPMPSSTVLPTATTGLTETPRPPTNTPTPPPPSATATTVEAARGRIAFAMLNMSGPAYSVYIGNADGSGKQLVAANSHQPQFNPDGSKLVFAGQGDFRAKLFVRTLTGGELGIDNTPIEARNPAWSPDGHSIIFASNEMEDRAWRIYVVDAGNTSDRRTTLRDGRTELIGRYPTWLAGGQILYSGCDVWATTSQCGIVRVNPDGSAPTLLTNQRLDTAPVGRGNNVLFMSARDGNWEIYSVPLGGGPVRNLSNSPSQDGLPAFSPDGQLIAFVSDRSGQWAVWAMRLDGSAQRMLFQLENGYANGGDLDWTSERISWVP